MATAINTTTPASLSDAAVLVGEALQLAIGDKNDSTASILRRALTFLFDAAAEAGGQQLEIDRLTRYIERLERKNSQLTGRIGQLQHQSEQFVATLSPALGEITRAFNQALGLKAAGSSSPLDITTRRGAVSDETLDAVRTAPDMAHGDHR